MDLTSGNENSVPLDALNSYYFQEVVTLLHPSMRRFALDRRVLRGETQPEQLESIAKLYDKLYLFTPWVLDDIFPLPEEDKLAIGKCLLVLAVAYVTLDQIIDRQMPDLPTVPLVQQHMLMAAHQAFSELFDNKHPFWSDYYLAFHRFYQALALESYCLDAHQQPYTAETMREVSAGKALTFQIVVSALAHKSNKLLVGELLKSIFQTLLYADQLSDDASDWEVDFQNGRHALPVIMAINAYSEDYNADIPVHFEEIKRRIYRKSIHIQMVNMSLAEIERMQDLLRENGFKQTKLYALLNEREEKLLLRRRVYLIGGFLNAFARRLEADS